MTTAIFWGRVLPERADVNTNKFGRELSVIGPGFEFTATLTLEVISSQVMVRVDGEWSGVDAVSLKNVVQSYMAQFIDAYGYTTGRGYDIEITGMVDSAGNQTVFGVDIPRTGAGGAGYSVEAHGLGDSVGPQWRLSFPGTRGLA